jgi:hypothetical protein
VKNLRILGLMILCGLCACQARRPSTAPPPNDRAPAAVGPPSGAGSGTSTVCSFNNGPAAGATHDYAPMAGLPIGSPCQDGRGSTGVIIAKVGPPGSTAQSTLTGTVQDATGAVIPGADVYAKSERINRHVKTNGQGQYTVSGLPSGTYSISVIASGFQATRFDGIAVGAGEAASRNATLQVGAATSEAQEGAANSAAPGAWGRTHHHRKASESPISSTPPAIPAFPTNPPKASTRAELPTLVMANGQATKMLGDINQVLSNALAQVGYGTTGYYSYPDGFALATRMEQIFPNGKSMLPPARFSDSPQMPRTFTLQYFEHLFVPQQGYFRIVVFIVTDQPIVESETTPTEAVASNWPDAGGDALPSVVANTPQPNSVKITAFVYEFKDSTAEGVSNFSLLDQNTIGPNEQLLDVKGHLQGAGLWEALRLP